MSVYVSGCYPYWDSNRVAVLLHSAFEYDADRTRKKIYQLYKSYSAIIGSALR